ncbi:TPA: hypothetical protein ACMY33_000620 [Yersinia enterocolitica]|uniref:hypothetical protein n=1 Tax=Yersinia TaxID=629 RepID=UPI0005E25559|nr:MULTISPECIES: hypothetical protein [Yersinia]CFQ33783.1 Uncharacterised protein [Yersinia aleksiciae]SQA35875.1 Uncharacterised protein [Yersinia enterocolitica]SUP63106.1 Uncharacterised protein [Yersinia enterocolitica]HDL8089416.1 hypothetical protein [Yersinia enterocolitica]HDL8567983.1 hypothetical protein [Yersinia enterocolitica]
MKTSVEVLSQASFKSILSRPAEGQVALTLLCLIDWPDGIQRQSYVKIFSDHQAIGVFNEILGYLLSKSQDLPVPPKAGILILPDGLKNEISLPVSPIAFVTSKVAGNSPSSFYNIQDMISYDALKNILAGWDKLDKTIAFDEWVANQDRNLGNVLINSSEQITLIDHSNMPVDLVWTPDDLVIDINPVNKLEFCFRQHPTLPQKMSIVRGAEDQVSCLQTVHQEIDYWCDKLIDPKAKNMLMLFLEQRANLSKSRLSKRLGVLGEVA